MRMPLGVGLAAVLCWAASAPAEETTHESGSSIFRTYCASCHGLSAKGDGPLTDSLRFRPRDLTLIAERNGGKFPSAEVFRIMDGRKPVKGHGSTEMPVWGDAFKSSRDGFSEEAVKQKIESLVEHLESLQAKKGPK